nr:MAG: hypothetical protein DIU75_05885 [Mycolicibacterium hassiacum]
MAATVVGVGAAVAAAGLAGADPGKSADEVIAQLERDGYSVTIDKIGTAPLSECVVTSIRKETGSPNTKPLRGGEGELSPARTSQPTSVSLDCSKRRARPATPSRFSVSNRR